jgi:hypothetical protein
VLQKRMLLSRCILPSLLLFSLPAWAMSLNIHDDGAVIFATLTGTIEPNTLNAIQGKLDKQVAKKPLAIFFQSGGGAYSAIKPMEKYFLSLAQKNLEAHGKPLMFVVEFNCNSACNILTAYLTKDRDEKALEIRTSKIAQFGFHGSIIINHGKTDKQATLEAKQELESQVIATYLDAGVSPAFIEANKAMFKAHFSEKTFTAADLCAQKAMVIPPGSCMDTELDIYKWIVRMTASQEQQKILIPSPSPEKLNDQDSLPKNETGETTEPYIR